MAADTTTYDVRVRYLLEDHATAATRQIEKATQAAARSTGFLKSGLGSVAAAAAGVFGLREAKKSLIDFNSDLEQAKIQMAGLFELNSGGAFNDNMAKAGDLVGRLQQKAKASVGTTKDMVDMAAMLAQPFSTVNASVAEMTDLTAAAVVGSKSMGIAAEVAARDIDQAMRGQFHAVDQFTGKILAPLGFSGEEGRRKFNLLSQVERFNKIRTALKAPALGDMAKAQEKSFAGVFSTFEDNLQMFMGRVGLPLFKAITKEIDKWNSWSEQNGPRLEQIATSIASGLTDAFEFIKTAVGFLADNRETILTIAKVWAGLKIGGRVASGLGGWISALRAQEGAVAGFGGTITSFTGKMTMAIEGLGAFYAGLQLAAAWLDHNQTKAISSASLNAGSLPAMLKGFNEADRTARFGGPDAMQLASSQSTLRTLYQQAKSVGLANEAGINTGALANSLEYASNKGEWAAAAGLNWTGSNLSSQEIAEAFARKFNAMMPEMLEAMKRSVQASSTPEMKKNAERPKVNVTIHRIEVASEDPDRFVFGLTEVFQRVVKNPNSARTAFREG